MFIRSIVIKRRVEDLQLGVESYQKKLNLTKPDTYQTDLRRREAYTTYSNPKGFIYQNKDKKNRLMRIDELHKFSDGMLNDVRNALDDRLKGIRMQYLSSTIWRKGDKDRATTMIQAIEKMLKTRRIMRSLEKFVGGRLTARGHLLNHMSNSLFDLFINQKSAKIIWETLEKKYGADDAVKKICCWKLVAVSDGHKAYQSKDRKDQQIPNQRLVAPQANLVEDEIIVAVVVKTNLVEDKSSWIMKSGASRQLCNNKRLFHQFEEVTDGGQVYIGNNGTARVVGNGKVFLKFTSGKILALNNVLYVPSLRRNMVSGSLLVRAGLKVTLEGDKVLKRFDYFDVDPVKTPYDSSKYLKKNKGIGVSQHKYAKIIGTLNWCLHFNRFPAVLEGYCDANWVSDNDEVSSTSGYVFTLGGCAISWKSSKQTCITRSTIEAEFIALELAG
nr:hypothetical protein [Tanacetum cinerariifolium]